MRNDSFLAYSNATWGESTHVSGSTMHILRYVVPENVGTVTFTVTSSVDTFWATLNDRSPRFSTNGYYVYGYDNFFHNYGSLNVYTPRAGEFYLTLKSDVEVDATIKMEYLQCSATTAGPNCSYRKKLKKQMNSYFFSSHQFT